MQTQNTTWLDTNEYPFQSHFFEINGQRMHYIDEGQGAILLFVHGTPSWSFDFRHQIKALSKQFRCVAIDHIGFGLSDKPEKYEYRTQQHAQNLQDFIAFLGLKNITLIVHDFGGAIGFHYALNFPDNIQKIVVLNSWLWDCSDEPTYQKMKSILKSPLLPFLYKYLNFSPKFLLPQSFFDKKKLTKAIHKQYISPFAKVSERKGTLAFAQSLRDDQAWFGSLWEKISVLSEKPILFLWGMDDAFVTPSYLHAFSTVFEHKKVIAFRECGHFPQEEKKEEVLKEIELFLVSPLRNKD